MAAIKGRFSNTRSYKRDEKGESYLCDKNGKRILNEFPDLFCPANLAKYVMILKFENGFAKVCFLELTFGSDNFAETISEYLDKDSEFISEFCKYCNCKEDDFKGFAVVSRFGDRQFDVKIKKEDAQKDKIIDLCKSYLNEDEIRKFNEDKIKEHKEAFRRKNVHKKILDVVNNNNIEFLNAEAEKEWNNFLEANRTHVMSEYMNEFVRNWIIYCQFLANKNPKINLRSASSGLLEYVDEDGYYSLMGISLYSSIRKKTCKYGDKI